MTETAAIDLYSMACSFGFIACLTLWLPFAVHATSNFQDRCLLFTPEAYVHNSTRRVLEYVAAGTNLTFPNDDPTCVRPSQIVAMDLCRVALLIPTSTRSSVRFELWLPEQWSNRFLAIGNEGAGGCE